MDLVIIFYAIVFFIGALIVIVDIYKDNSKRKGIKMNMTKERAIELLKIERECIIRNNQPFGKNCNRDCAKCDLLQDTSDLINMYDYVITDIGQDYNKGRINALDEYKDILIEMTKLSGKPLDISDLEMVAAQLKEKKND